MVEYSCIRCSYDTKRVTKYISHLLRKYPCKPVKTDVDIDSCKKIFISQYLEKNGDNERSRRVLVRILNVPKNKKTSEKGKKTSEKGKKTSEKGKQMSQNIGKRQKTSEKGKSMSQNFDFLLKCPDCERIFACKRNLERHKAKKTSCILEKTKYKCHNCSQEFKKYSSFWSHKKKCSSQMILSEEFQDDTAPQEILDAKSLAEENKKLKKEIDQLRSARTIVNNDNKFIINFGSETRNHVTNADMYNFLQYPFSAVQRLIGLVHFDPEHPENNNVKINNIRDNKAYVIQDGKWVVHSKEEVIDSLVDNSYNQINNFQWCNKNNEEYNRRIQFDRIEKLNKHIDDKNSSIRQKINRETEYVVLNQGYNSLNKCINI